MKQMKINGARTVIIFIIFLIVITVFAWKACSKVSETSNLEGQNKIQVFSWKIEYNIIQFV